ncbi:MAG: cell division protein ZapE [Steroidobacterales bacterium]
MAPASVAASLQREIAAQRLEADAAQLAAAARLDQLSAELRAAPRTQGPLHRLRRSWLGGAAPGAPRGVYLWGGVGRGKTCLLDLFYASLDFPERERTHFYRFMRNVHAGLRQARRRADPLKIVARRFAERARVICLDEFFVSDIADAMILAGLLDGLFHHGVTLVATSNQPPHGLYPGGLQRQRFLPAINLLEKHVDVLPVNGPVDYRLRRLESAHTYFDAALRQTDGRLRRLFDALTQGASSGPVEIPVGDRRISALDTGAGVAWFEFDALCSTARSAEDYIELARLYPTIFITHVPVLDGADDDAARRLLVLIDEFYDRGVKVVISAYAAPAGLYRGQRLGFEFQRTASRLAEMQSQQYLGREHRA